MNRLLPVALLLTATIASAQDAPRRFAVGRFDAVELASSDNVRVIPGSEVSVTASGDPRAIAALAIEVRQGALHVGRRPGSWHDDGALVTVVVPTLRAAAITGSGDISVGAVAGRSFAASVPGSGNLTAPQLRVDAARFDLGGSGSIMAGGRAAEVTIDLGGSGRVDTYTLLTPAVTVDLGGSGSVTAAASRTASVRAGGSGSVRVEGGARCDVRQAGTATVRCG